MGIFDRLFGKREDPANGSLRSQSYQATSNQERPFDLINEALEAWKAQELERAERLLQAGIVAYRQREPNGIDFALGRYGAFLLDQERPDKAAHVLEEAIRMGTFIPAIWRDYMTILAIRRDVAGLFSAAHSMNEIESLCADDHGASELLGHASRASRAGDHAFAEDVSRRVMEEATKREDKATRWLAAGDLGQILERAERIDEAMSVWTACFEEGSNNPITANRLSLNLERAKRYDEAARVCKDALERKLPANVEEQLRKRLNRLETKLNPTKKRKDVPVYSVRTGDGVFDPQFQFRIKPPIRSLAVIDSVARCFGVSKGAGTLIDIDLNTGSELRRIEDLPEFREIVFAPDGSAMGVRRTSRIGEGPTALWFIEPSGDVVAETSIPDASSEIVFGPELWYVGCRDGRLYAFDQAGATRWQWETPGARGYEGSPYFRPCPCYVATDGDTAFVASWENIYAISRSGATIWRASLPNEKQTTYTYSVPLGERPSLKYAYKTLGVPAGSPSDEVKKAYLAHAKRTHPDLNPRDAHANDKFREIQSAYEAIVAGDSADVGDGPAIELTVEFVGLTPTASFINANSKGMLVGSSQGHVYQLDTKGRILQARKLGEGHVYPALNPDGTLAAAWCNGVLSFIDGSAVVSAIEVSDRPGRLTVMDDDILIWQRNRIELHARDGRTLWVAEFSRNLSDVATLGNQLVCGAGSLVSFRRTDN